MIQHHAYPHLWETPLYGICKDETRNAVNITSAECRPTVKECFNRHNPPLWLVVLVHNLVLPGQQISRPLTNYFGGGI